MRNKGYIVTVVATVGSTLAFIAVVLRLYARLTRQGGKMMMDDITVIITLVCISDESFIQVSLELMMPQMLVIPISIVTIAGNLFLPWAFIKTTLTLVQLSKTA